MRRFAGNLATHRCSAAAPPRCGRGRREGEANAKSRDCYVDCRRDWICRGVGGRSRAGQQHGAETSRDREQSHHPRSALALGQPVAASLPRSAQPLVVVLIIASGMSFGPDRETPGPLLSGARAPTEHSLFICRSSSRACPSQWPVACSRSSAAQLKLSRLKPLRS